MSASDGNTIMQAMRHALSPSVEDRAARERVSNRRHAVLEPRQHIDRVMISDRTGKTYDITTGRPPATKQEVREAWARAREEASIDKLFR